MLNLKLKAKIYQYTTIYLATQEEKAYLRSDEAKTYINKLVSNPENEMDEDDARGVTVGMWQGHYGFYRPMSSLRFKLPLWFFRPLATIHESFIMLKWDIKDTFKSLKSYLGL